MTLSRDKKSVIRARIAVALPLFHFRKIETLFYLDERGHEVTELVDARPSHFLSPLGRDAFSRKPYRQQLRNLAIPRRQPA